MRVLLATDGSRSAGRARDLVATLPWPDGTVLRVVTSLEPRTEIIGTPWVLPPEPEVDQIETRLVTHARNTLEEAERTLARPGLAVEAFLLRGRPATCIVDEASDWPADLVVVGSRGHGAISAMVLGSVSAEVIDRAPCPVLVVRDAVADEVVLAADGSDGALLAEKVLTAWPILRHLPASVVTVTDTRVPLSGGMPAGLYDEVGASWAHDVTTAREGAAVLAEEAAARLRVAGVAAVGHVRDGDPAHVLVEFARTLAHPLIVMGTHGRRGLARLLLGSVARNVLANAAGSVLVVRDTVRVRAQGDGSAAVTTAAAGR